MKSRLRQPDICAVCGRRGNVVSSRRRSSGYIWRRHECTSAEPACSEPPNRWTSYQILVSPADIDPGDIRRQHLLNEPGVPAS